MPLSQQYQHYIPQFMLRRFIPENDTQTQVPRKTKKQRQKEARKAFKKRLPDPESIAIFDMQTMALQTAPIRKVFGAENFYDDILQTDNMKHLEQKLSVLENDAARVVSDLHRAADRNSPFILPRSDLQILRKFIFIMYYRSAAVDKTYFQEDHPRNAHVREWIRKVKEEKGYTSDRQIWLEGLEYYLETPHQDILNHAAESGERDRGFYRGEVTSTTAGKHWHSIAYETSFNDYFMGIWRAASTSEFALGQNSFGLWEGTFMGVAELFKIYVVSPQITLVLKRRIPGMGPSDQAALSELENSTLASHPLSFPKSRYHRPPPALTNPSTRPSEKNSAFQAHLNSPNSKHDVFTFTTHVLNHRQTYLVNQVVLENLRADGSLAFCSHTKMLDTARQYDTPEGPFRKKNRQAMAALVNLLLNPTTPTFLGDAMRAESSGTQSPPVSPSDNVHTPGNYSSIILLNHEGLQKRGIPIPRADLAFDKILVNILQGSVTFANDYERAIHVSSVCPTADDGSIHPFVAIVASRMRKSVMFVDTMDALTPQEVKDNSKYKRTPGQSLRLAETLRKDAGDHLLRLVCLKLEPWTRNWTEEDPFESKDVGRVLLEHVTAVVYLQYLVGVKPILAENICPSVDFIEIVQADSAGSGLADVVADEGMAAPRPQEHHSTRPRVAEPEVEPDGVGLWERLIPSDNSYLSKVILLDLPALEKRGVVISEYDLAFDAMLVDILEGSIKFRSDYDRGMYITNIFPNLETSIHPLAKKSRRMVERSFDYIDFSAARNPVQFIVDHRIPPGATVQLVKSLEKDKADRLLRDAQRHLEPLFRSWRDPPAVMKPTGDPGMAILNHVTVLAYLDLQDPSISASISKSVSFIEVVTEEEDGGELLQSSSRDVDVRNAEGMHVINRSEGDTESEVPVENEIRGIGRAPRFGWGLVAAALAGGAVAAAIVLGS